MLRLLLGLCVVALGVSASLAHDTWVQTNTNIIRVGDAVHIDLMLGNHGNEHRDFKLASKVDPASCTLEVIAPDGRKFDVRDRLIDVGYAPKEGFHTTRFAAMQQGLYTIAHTFDKVVNHGEPTRSIKSGKTYFLVSASLDKVTPPAVTKPLGHPLELVPVSNTVAPMGPGNVIKLQLLLKGKPLANTKVSFVPRGVTLKEGMDDKYERTTDAEGKVSYTPNEGNYHLVVAHAKEPVAGNSEYASVSYTATLTVYVPEVCSCCE